MNEINYEPNGILNVRRPYILAVVVVITKNWQQRQEGGLYNHRACIHNTSGAFRGGAGGDDYVHMCS